MPNIDLSILNQRATPAFFADTLANRPAPSFVGRIFISTDTLDLYRDTGTAWLLLSPSSTGTITGSGAAGQVTIFSGASSITGTNNLFWDTSNLRLGINTNTPGAAIDLHSTASTLMQLNQTTATNDTRIAFQNSGTALWRIGNFYNAGANDWGIFDVVGAAQPFTIKKTTGQTFIGAETTSSGRLVVNNATGDNHIVVIGATAPSIRINNAGSGATRQIGIGLATAVNNFIQGAAGGEMAIFNSNTTASPILFGIYDAGLSNTQEAARISSARNFLIGTSVDGGQRLQISGSARATGYFLDGMTSGAGALYYSGTENRVTLANYNASGILVYEVNGGSEAMRLNASSQLLVNRATNFNAGTYTTQSLQVTNGIGINSDSADRVSRLSLLGNSSTGDGTIDWGGNGNFNLIFSNNGSERMRINSSGNVGIGTATPSQKLTIGATNGYPIVDFYNSGTGFGDIGYNAGTTSFNVSSYSTTPLAFYTNGSERARLTSGGALLIASTIDNGFSLQVNGVINSKGTSACLSTQSRDGSNNYFWIGYTTGFRLYNDGNGSFLADINPTTGVYTPLSDINKKKNFEASNLGLDAVLKLKPTLYNMKSQKDSQAKELGFIAQEVKEVIAQAYVENGEFIGLNYNPIIATLVKAVQELNTKIENLK